MRFVALWWIICFALGAARADWCFVPVCGVLGSVLHQVVWWPQLQFDFRLGSLEWVRCLVWCCVARCAVAGFLMGAGHLFVTIATLP